MTLTLPGKRQFTVIFDRLIAVPYRRSKSYRLPIQQIKPIPPYPSTADHLVGLRREERGYLETLLALCVVQAGLEVCSRLPESSNELTDRKYSSLATEASLDASSLLVILLILL